MRRAKLNFGEPGGGDIVKLAAIAFLLTGLLATRAMGQQPQPGQKTFSSPEEASRALYTAAQSNDTNAMMQLLGPEGKDVVSSGDEGEDAHNRANFAKRYQEMSRLMKEPDGSVTLYVGSRNWPYPIPLVNKGNQWYFDTEAGKQEILYRRIGWNEASTIRICQELAAAQKEYYAKEQNQYAQKIFSDEGKQDGLYWKVASGQPQSPIGPLVAWAVAQEYADSRGEKAVPYRGYYFHILTKQGKDGPGGAKNFLVDGKMTGGFAFVAYPAEYRVSGVMTFVVGEDGVVYEKDLGKKTDTVAKAMKEYNPDSHWTKSEGEHEQTAGGDTSK
jgi:Protein of unknown function (DUF2950)